MVKFLQFTLLFLFIALTGHFATLNAQNRDEGATASFKGRLFRSDTNKPIANATVSLTKQNQSYETYADPEGNFIFDKVVPEKYTFVIHITYDNEKDVPCKLSSGRLKDEKDSSLLVLPRENKKVYLIFIKNFVLEPKQNITKDYDLVCVSDSNG